MQKWEYIELFTEVELFSDSSVVKKVNGESIGQKGKYGFRTIYPKVSDYLNALGDAGWELVSTLQGKSIFHQYYYYLKRPKQDGAGSMIESIAVKDVSYQIEV